MGIRQIHRAGAEPDVLGLVGEAREEGDGRGDDLGPVRCMLAAVSFGKAQFISKNKGFAILRQALRHWLSKWMDRHGEKR